MVEEQIWSKENIRGWTGNSGRMRNCDLYIIYERRKKF